MLGEILAKVRKKRKMTQGDMCEIIDKTQSYLSMLENDKADPSLGTIKKIAKAVNVPYQLLFFLAIKEDDIPEDKVSVFKILKPAMDEFIIAIFDEDKDVY